MEAVANIIESHSRVAMLLAALTAAPLIATAETIASPANAPAAVEWKAAEGRLSLRYHGGVIFEATVRAKDASGAAVAGAEVKLEQEYRFFSKLTTPRLPPCHQRRTAS